MKDFQLRKKVLGDLMREMDAVDYKRRIMKDEEPEMENDPGMENADESIPTPKDGKEVHKESADYHKQNTYANEDQEDKPLDWSEDLNKKEYGGTPDMEDDEGEESVEEHLGKDREEMMSVRKTMDEMMGEDDSLESRIKKMRRGAK